MISADAKTKLTIAATLCVAELFMIVIVKVSTSRLKKTLDREMQGKSLDKLDPDQQEALFSKASDQHFRTVYRKLELLVIAYHLPALVLWGTVKRKSTAPLVLYVGVTFIFWFSVALLVSNLIG